MSPSEQPRPSLVSPAPRSATTIVPILRWLPRYRWGAHGPKDAIAGIALAALLIPESMGYAGVAGVPAEVGLYAALGAVFAYALFGGTSILVVGPASAVAAVSASVAGDIEGVDPRIVISALALTSGVLLVVAGVLRLGWIVNFISRPVLEAFVAGLSISIIIGQLDGLFGVEVEGESAVAKLVDVLASIGDWHPLTVVIGVGCVVTLLLLERMLPKVPAAVVVVVVGIVLVLAFDLAEHGVAIVGDIPQGLPGFSLPDLSASRWFELAAGGLALLLVGFSEGYASSSSVAARTGERVDPDQELVGSGAANIASGFLGGLAVSGSLSKTSASMAAGARSQMANVVAGLVVVATLLFLGPLFEKLPEPVLAGVVIVAVLRSADPRRIGAMWAVNRLDFAAGLVTFVLVLVWETLPAMIVGVVLSLAFVVRRASFPDAVELRRGSDGAFHAVGGNPTAGVTAGAHEELSAATTASPSVSTADVVVLRFDAPLIYANAERFALAATRLTERHPNLTRLVVDAEMFSDLDTSGAERLELLDDELAQRGIELHLARVHARAREQIGRSRLAERFSGRIHSSLTAATES